MGRRWFLTSIVLAFALTFLQSPGLSVADTKYDLTQNPIGLLQRSAHLWSSQSPMGQVQNQAYGYFFPQGAFFSLGHVLGLPGWATQRSWWALLILTGFWGIVRLCELLGIGSRGSRVIAGLAFALSPRVLTTLGSISSETLPMMLAPWVLLGPAALAVALRARGRAGGATSPAASALALALMGSVNAAATAAGFLPAVLWWASYRPDRRWLRFTLAWIPLLVTAVVWWLVPLALLGKVSPPFLDYIESSGVTTEWATLGEVLRGTDSWTPFVSPERIAGAVLVTQPAAVLATGLLAAAGLAGLASRSMPHRGRFALILIVGLIGICAGYQGQLGGPFAETVRIFLDSAGAPMRNVHKLEPLIRMPLVIGLAHLLRRVPLPASVPFARWRHAFAHPERDRMVAVTMLVLTALLLSTSLAWTSKLAPRGAYDRVPVYWQQTADWLAHNASDTRALVVPGAPFGSQIWGLTRDEPLQALARTEWAVRDAIPLVPPGAIRAMDSVQRLIADGRPSAGLAPVLADQGIGILVLRNDLDPDTSRSTRPLLAHQAIEHSPGLTRVAEFGGLQSIGHPDDIVVDGDLRPPYPAIEIFRVDAPRPGTPTDPRSGPGDTDPRSGPGAPDSFPGAYTVPLAAVPVVQGGPEVLERLRRDPAAPRSPVLLATDADRAGLLDDATTTVTDTPMNRETDFGRVDNHSSALRAPTDPRRTHNLVPDYPVPGAPLVQGEWSGAVVTASSSAGDATQLGAASPANSTAAAVDGDPATAWLSNSAQTALGQWLRLDLHHPITSGVLHVTTSPAALGDPVKWLEVRTANGTVAARITTPGAPVQVSLPPGRTDWLTVTAIRTESGTPGGQFGVSELSLDDYSNPDAPVTVDIRHRTVLPAPPPGVRVQGWDLGQEFPGRNACFDTPGRVRCNKGLALPPEEPGTFERTLQVPAATAVTPQLTVRTRQGPALAALLTDHDRPVARGRADVGDLRGSAFAATDDNNATSWTAPEETVRDRTGAKPTLTIELPHPALVNGLMVTPPIGDLPARPTALTVNLGDGPQFQQLNPEVPGGFPIWLPLHPRVTDRIEISIDSWRNMLDRNGLGFAQQPPPGLAEVTVLGPDYPPPVPGNRLVTVDCAHGPVLTLAGRLVHTTVTGTLDELRTGAPVPARVCDPGTDDAATVPASGDPATGDGDTSTVAGDPSNRIGTAATGSPDGPTGVDGSGRAVAAGTSNGTGTAASDSPTGTTDSGGSGADRTSNGTGTAANGSTNTPTGTTDSGGSGIDGTPSGTGTAANGSTNAPTGTVDARRGDSGNVAGGIGTAATGSTDGDRSGAAASGAANVPAATEATPPGDCTDSATPVAGAGGRACAAGSPRPDAIALPAGRVDVAVAPTELFAVDRLTLTSTDVAPHPVSAAPGTRLLVLPLSTNVDWRARTADGRNLAPVVVDGWEQGWVVPADAHGPITVEFPADRWYRTAIRGGLALLIPLALLVIPRRRRIFGEVDAGPVRAQRSRLAGAVGLSAAVLLIAGPVALAATVAGSVALRFAPRRVGTALPLVAGLGVVVAEAALSTGTWRSPGGYLGGSLWVQLPALLGVVAAGLAALPPHRRDRT
ncbi:alpha-(1-_3)-arabinofuranosyltransferase family protein [Nocardia sp. alder85J]|nr:alpha-(1->3)-arabinofuranosyltransferase family protein [Nocardia sp. alder85J]MCX4096313.1 alpha-(1->3)-arabinofuranosyltransferase family protein [Nocardia sp. alder85J]